MQVAVVGGGINGLCVAWMLGENGHHVTLYDRGDLLGETSSSSSKLLHGGLRYLENFEFRLVKEALSERAWWLKNVPQHTSAIRIIIPLYVDSRRSSWKIKLGLMLYDWLAGGENIASHKSYSVSQASEWVSDLKVKKMQSVFIFYDGKMDEAGLGHWVADQAQLFGVKVVEHCEVKRIFENGKLAHAEGEEEYDCIVNAAGPWSLTLNKVSDIESKYELDLVRGSHIVLNRQVSDGFLLEVPNERRIFFVLPYKKNTLVGTTELRQTLDESVACSQKECDYLLAAYNHYFTYGACENDIIDKFAGIRPLLKSSNDLGKTTREYAIERKGKVVSVYGGKWTTARALANKVLKEVNRGIH